MCEFAQVVVMMKLFVALWFAAVCTITRGYSWRRVRSIQFTSLFLKPFRVSTQHAGLVHNTSPIARFRDSSDEDDQRKKEALHLLDCLTSPKDEDDPQYDVAKDIRRDNLLVANDYADLKTALRRKGLRTSGDKLEMITRLLLHVIDPSIKYEEISGIGPNLSYINEEDISSKKVRVRSKEERATDSPYNIEPDADDLMVLKGRGFGSTGRVPYSASNVVDNEAREGAWSSNRQLVMDGLSRKEVTFLPLQVRRSEAQSHREDFAESNSASRGSPISLPAYVVASKDVLKRWTHNSAAIVLLPETRYTWQSKAIRVMADELAFAAQVVVVVPDIYRGISRTAEGGSEHVADATALSAEQKEQPPVHPDTQFDDVVAAIHFARTEYGAKSVSLAGVGCGAGKALEAACDLHDLGRLAQFVALENRILKEDRHQRSRQPTRAAVRADEPNVRKLIEFAVEDENSSVYGEIRAVLAEYRKVFLKPVEVLVKPQQVVEEDGHGPETTQDRPAHKATSPREPAAGAIDATVESALKGVVEDAGDLLTEQKVSDFLSTAEPFQQLSQIFDSMGEDTGDTGDGSDSSEKARISIGKVLQDQQDVVAQASLVSSQQATMSTADDDKTRAEAEHRAIQREVQLLLEASERAEKRKLLAPYAALNLQEIQNFVPRSVLAFAPERFDVERVGRELVVPTFFAYHCSGGSGSGSNGVSHPTEDSGSSAAEKMHSMLAERINDVRDYCFRVYNGTSTADFAHSPITEYDTQCSQEAVAMGALWADAFAAQEAEELPEGLGQNKLSEGAFCEVTVEDMTSPVRPSALATYLHDDPTWLRNSRLEY